MKFEIEITDEMMKDAVKNSVSEIVGEKVLELIEGTDVIWEIVEKVIKPSIIAFIKSDKCNIDKNVMEIIENHIDNGDWLDDKDIAKIVKEKIMNNF